MNFLKAAILAVASLLLTLQPLQPFEALALHGDHKVKLEVDLPWARETTPSARNGAAYMSLTYKGKEPVVLTGATTDRAGMVMIHNTVEVDGVARMRDAGEITLQPGETLTFEPGGRHFMLMGLKERLAKGQIFRLTLTFKDHEDFVIPVRVTPVTGPEGLKNAMKMDKMKRDKKMGHHP